MPVASMENFMRFVSRLGLVATLAFGLLAGPTLAHPKLKAASPAANAAASGVSRVSLTFSETLMPKLSGATLIMTGMPGMTSHPDMKMAGVKTAVTGKAIELVSDKPLPAGSYRVDWHIVGADTHRITGQHSFSVR